MFIPQLMVWLHTLRSDDMLEGSLLLAGIVVALAVVVVAFVRLATRWRAPLGVAAKRGAAVVVAVMLVGCGGGGCVDLLMRSLIKLNFQFYDFSVIYYDFSNIQRK
jgi:hypothetical protein